MIPNDENKEERQKKKQCEPSWLVICEACVRLSGYAGLLVASIAFLSNTPLDTAAVWPKRVAVALFPYLVTVVGFSLILGLLNAKVNHSNQIRKGVIAALVAIVLTGMTI